MYCTRWTLELFGMSIIIFYNSSLFFNAVAQYLQKFSKYLDQWIQVELRSGRNIFESNPWILGIVWGIRLAFLTIRLVIICAGLVRCVFPLADEVRFNFLVLRDFSDFLLKIVYVKKLCSYTNAVEATHAISNDWSKK